MRKIRKKKKKLTPKLIIISIFIAIFLINNKLKPNVYKKCSFEINRFATDMMNEAINQAIKEYGFDYDDYVKIETDDYGNILAIFTNARQIALIQTAIVDNVNKMLGQCNWSNIYISLGSLTGIVWLASRGPNIPIKIQNKSCVNSEILSSLEEAGVNQTLHKIHIKVYADVIGFLPFTSIQTKAECSCMLSETLIVGKVPHHYTKVEKSEDTKYKL